MNARFILGSASPARLRLLRNAGVDAEVIISNVDEQDLAAALAGASTAEVATSLATAKAVTVAAGVDPPALVLGCDSLLEFRGESLGKPGSAAAAADRWRRLRGDTGTLHTGHCLIDVATGRTLSEVSSTLVRFAEVDDDDIDLYCASGEPEQVAGAFTIDGLGGWFVDGVDGDPHNVVGLSLPLLRGMLDRLGYRLRDIGYPAQAQVV